MKDSELKKHLDPSLYRILCADRNATPELIKKNWRGIQMNIHPDKNENVLTSEGIKIANEKSAELNFAFSVLSNPIHKSQYDKILDEYNAKKDELIRKVKEEEKIREEKLKFQQQGVRKMPSKRKNPQTEAFEEIYKSLKKLVDDMKVIQKKGK